MDTPLRSKLLILDLDETLIHATEMPLDCSADFHVGPFYIYKRPYLDEFLEACLSRFHTAVWTSASPDFAVDVVSAIFPSPNSLAFLWASNRCSRGFDSETGEHYWRKPLNKVRRHRGYLKADTIVVDDTPQKWEQSYGNLVRVTPYYGELDDDELLHLLPYLDFLRTVSDVRPIEKRGWRQKLL